MKALLRLMGLIPLFSALLLVVSGCWSPVGPSPGMRTLTLPGHKASVLFLLISQHYAAAMHATEAFVEASVRPGERIVILSTQGGGLLASSVAPRSPSVGVPAPPPPLSSQPTAYQEARHSQALQRYRNTVRRARAVLQSRQQQALSAWAKSTVAEAFTRPILQSVGNLSINQDLGVVAADQSSLRQAGWGDDAVTVIAIAGIPGDIAGSAPTLPTGLRGSTVIVDDFPGSIGEECDWQASLLASGASRVVLLTPATDDQMAAVLDESLDDAVTDTLTSVLFGLDQYEIRPAALPQLLRLLYLLTVTYPQAPVTIDGYTDSLPAAMPGGNLQLSRLRADQIEQWLIAHEVAPDRIQAFGYGDTDPVAPNTPAGQPLNRRVVVVIDPALSA